MTAIVGRIAFCAAFAWSAMPLVAAAQPSLGAVVGVVTTADGAPVGGAMVELDGKRSSQTDRTDASGRFNAENLPEGTYSVRVDARGFDRLAGRTIDVRSGESSRVTLVLARSATSLTTIGTPWRKPSLQSANRA